MSYRRKEYSDFYLIKYYDKNAREHITDCPVAEIKKVKKYLEKVKATRITAYRATTEDYARYLRLVEYAKKGVPTTCCYDKSGVDNPTQISKRYMELFGENETETLLQQE